MNILIVDINALKKLTFNEKKFLIIFFVILFVIGIINMILHRRKLAKQKKEEEDYLKKQSYRQLMNKIMNEKHKIEQLKEAEEMFQLFKQFNNQMKDEGIDGYIYL